MKAAVHPYTEDLLRNDAFRGPLATTFKLHLLDLAVFSDRATGLDMDHECLRTDGLSPRYRDSLAHLLPDYGCLILSPANIWRRDPTTYQEDPSVVETVFNFQRSREGHSSLADIMFGLRQRDTGLTKYPVNNRQRIITYSVTVVLRQHKPQFIAALKKHLKALYPMATDSEVNNTSTVHIYFPEKLNGEEYIPYTITIGAVFVYVYYSCNKIELVKSKVGIALTAVITILGSLFMSLGLTGLSWTASNGYVYLVPYLVAVLGLENMLVVTRSVVSTPAHLDVKVRVAQGLSKEGWNITKNLFSEITVLTLGFFLGILDSSIQDFCLLAVMGLLTDFFLQIFFFVTVFAMDISRTRLVDAVERNRDFQRPVSGPGLRIATRQTSEGLGLVAPSLSPRPSPVSRRVKLFNFWAQRRVVSRFFLAAMVGWISIFIYQSGLVETLMHGAGWVPKNRPGGMDLSSIPKDGALMSAMHGRSSAENLSSIIASHSEGRKQESLARLQHRDADYWRRLPYSHWPMLFGLYNISVYGQNLALLPPILLSTVISPEAAVKLRSPHEKDAVGDHPVWTLERIQSALEVGDDEDLEDREEATPFEELSPFVPTNLGELLLALALLVPSLLFLVYLGVVCYRFVCTKNYAEWRSGRADTLHDFCTQIVQEGAPLALAGHQQDIEHLATDGHLVLSHCLAGKVTIWDSLTGQPLTTCSRGVSPPSTPSPEPVMPPSPTRGPRSRHSGVFRKFNKHFNTTSTEVLSPQPLRATPDLPAIWSVDLAEDLVILGCDTGRVEVWDALTGEFRCQYDDGAGNSVSHLRLVAGRVIVARLEGQLDFLELVSSPGPQSGCRVRLLSATSTDSLAGWSEEVRLCLRHTARAHTQAITCLALQGNRLLTGSQDHTIRVFRPEDGVGVYTLHGHTGPISSLFIDRLTPSAAGSASVDGLLCVWDLLTGACMYSIQVTARSPVS